jgi:pimeloyl-ACP methyl ester carboxylesterase
MAERLDRTLDIPVLAIGAKGGVGDLLAKVLHGSVPRLHSVVVPGCGHYVPEEDPDAFIDAVLSFWNDVAADGRQYR